MSIWRGGGGNRKWTVILGENGTGKSTILKSIALVMLGSEGITDHLGEPDDWISSGQSQGTIRLKSETLSIVDAVERIYGLNRPYEFGE